MGAGVACARKERPKEEREKKRKATLYRYLRECSCKLNKLKALVAKFQKSLLLKSALPSGTYGP